MPRLKFVTSSISRAAAGGSGGFQSQTVAQTMYLESNAVEIAPDGTNTLIIDKVTRDQYHVNKAYTAVVTALDSASPSVGIQIDLT